MRGSHRHDLAHDGTALLAQQRLGQRQQGLEARVAALVDGVPEAGQPPALAEHVVQRPRRAVALGHDEQLVGLLAGAAVERTGQGGQPGQEGVIGVGAHRCREADGHGRGGELVIRQEDEGRIHGGGRHRRRGGSQARPEPRRDGVTRSLPGGRRPHHVGQRGGGAAGGPRHRGRTQVGPQGVRRPAQDQRPAHALERGGQRAGSETRGAPVARTIGLPEELGDLLEAPIRRQPGGGPPAVDRAEPLVELGHGGRDRRQPGRRLTPSTAPHRQRLDVVQVEEAPPPGRVGVRIEQATADVGVQRRHLDPEASCRLLRREHALHRGSLY